MNIAEIKDRIIDFFFEDPLYSQLGDTGWKLGVSIDNKSFLKNGTGICLRIYSSEAFRRSFHKEGKTLVINFAFDRWHSINDVPVFMKEISVPESVKSKSKRENLICILNREVKLFIYQYERILQKDFNINLKTLLSDARLNDKTD